jgi:Zn-dependent oligopeptidase
MPERVAVPSVSHTLLTHRCCVEYFRVRILLIAFHTNLHSMNDLSVELERLSDEFLDVHTRKEDLFWNTKMGLSNDPVESQKHLSAAEIEVQNFMQNADTLRELRELESTSKPAADEETALKGWINFFQANAIEDQAARTLSAEIIGLEGALQAARNGMNLGYTDPTTGKFVPATSTLLKNMLSVEKDEALRKAAFEGLLSIEPFTIANGFLEIVKKRNELGRMLGYEDYYDMKVSKTEGFSKKRLFDLLDDLEAKTRERGKASIEAFVKENGASAKEGWNFVFLTSGDLAREMDPYFPFSKSLEQWTRSFSALGIRYRGATLTLDLIDRKGKYENGFMHGPVPSFFDKGKWNPARINFTANAMPNQVGAGLRALTTLFHEGGHAAHFSNVLMNAPCFAQEFAPTSVAYAETQSMFLDSIIGDADWKTRYAKSKTGETIPFDLITRAIRQNNRFEAIVIRSMLTVCYVEKALYEMSDSELTEANVLGMIRATEQRLQFLNAAPRPILSVPHLLAGESSAYYHGYVMAEMAVHQTREYFLEKYGYLMDNPNIGPELAKGYWAPGNSVGFMDLVEKLTGKPFSPDALVANANRSADEAVAAAKKKIEQLANIPEYSGALDLDADVRVVHGNEEITRFSNSGFDRANMEFVRWVEDRYPSEG